MDVKISYGINLDEVPRKIIEILHNSTSGDFERKIHLAAELIEISADNAYIASQLIEQTREDLASLDRTLNDCQMILKGYTNAKSNLAAPVAEEGETTDAK